MKIWIINHYAIPPSLGGLVRHYYFSKYLRKEGHQVRIFASGKVHNTPYNMVSGHSLYKVKKMDGVPYTFVRSRDYDGNGLDRILNLIEFPFQTLRAMKKFYRREKPDIIYASSPDLFVTFAAVLFGRLHHIPVTVEVRDLWPESIVEYQEMSGSNPMIIALYQLEKWIYRKADRLIFTMAGGKRYIRDKKWEKAVSLDKIRHVNNGVDLEEFEYNKTHFKLEDEDLDNTNFKAVYMGSVRYVNNLGTLIEAAEVLKKRGIDDIQILIYGEGTEKEELEQICAEKGLNVKFKGKVEKKYIPYVLSKADLNLVNVRKSGVNRYGCSWNKLFEYMASGKPILSNLPVSYDLIRKFRLGTAKDFSSPEEYADEILRYKNMDKEEYNQYCINEKELVQTYDYQKLKDKLYRILQGTVKEYSANRRH